MFKKPLATIFLLVSAFSTSAPTYAHDKWANGEPVPDWIKHQCCGVAEAHRLTAEEVHLRSDGYHIDGYRWVVPISVSQPSPDGEYWIFYPDNSSSEHMPSQGQPRCFFVPPSTI